MNELVDRLASDIVALVEKRDHVTMAEVSRIPGMTAAEDSNWVCGFGIGEHIDLILWVGMTKEGREAAHRVLGFSGSPREVDIVPASQMHYLIDGATLPIPLATNRKLKAKRTKVAEFWQPILLRPLGRAPAKHLILNIQTPGAPQ